MNLNKVFILGRLTADPVLRATPSGAQVASFSVATNRVWNDKSGARQDETEYHNVVVWGKQAEVASQFLTKGGLVLVEGRLQTRSWQNQQGQNVKTTEIICERMQLGPRPGGSGGFAKNQSNQTDQSKKNNLEEDLFKDELPEIDINEVEIKAEDLPF